LFEVAFNILESRLQAVEMALEFLELPTRDDEIVPTESMGGGQLAGHMGLLAASLLAIDPAPAGAFLFR
jgi:hypothetical protein